MKSPFASDPADWLFPKIWQGSRAMLSYGRLKHFSMLVLCAEEVQPPRGHFRDDLRVVRCPLVDDGSPLSLNEQALASHTAMEIARSAARGRRVLVTCNMGLNRSGLVSAMAIHRLTGSSGVTCMAIVARRRPGALQNRAFRSFLSQLPTTRPRVILSGDRPAPRRSRSGCSPER